MGNRTDTGQVIDTEGVTPKGLKIRRVPGAPEVEQAQVELIQSSQVERIKGAVISRTSDTGIGEAATAFSSIHIAFAEDRSRALRYNGSVSAGRAWLGRGEVHHRGPPG